MLIGLAWFSLFSEDAARRRTERALDKLRVALGRRGIASTAAALSSAASAQPIATPPAGLAAALSAQALAASATASGLAVTLWSLMNAKHACAAVLVALFFFGTGAFVGIEHTSGLPPSAPVEIPDHSKTIGALRRDNTRMTEEIGRLNAANASLSAERTSLQSAVIAA